MNPVLFSSASEDWETPQFLFDALDARFNFTVDVCASERNAKCSVYYSREINGLEKTWTGVCWMNPPYGREAGDKWLAKAHSAARNGATVVALIPVRSDTKAWHKFVQPILSGAEAGEVYFVKGRLKFGHEGGVFNSAPFPSAVVVFAAVGTNPDLNSVGSVVIERNGLAASVRFERGIGRPGGETQP